MDVSKLLLPFKFRLLHFFHKFTGISKKDAHVYKEDQPSLSNLPNDVLCNHIFTRLPAKLVARMRCVSKSWNALLSKPSFINSHLHHSMHNNKDEEILMVFKDGFRFRNNVVNAHPFEVHLFTVHGSRSPHHQLTSVIKLPVNVPSSKCTFCHVIGSVNGLVCFKNDAYSTDPICIWNPSLSALLRLPPSPKSSNNDLYLFRFGYDPKTDDYKVVKLTSDSAGCSFSFYTHDLFYKSWAPVVEVYSMRKGSWESIAQSFPSHIKSIFNQNEVCTDGQNGHIHWLCYIDEEMTREAIVAFDLEMEMFNEISLPASIQHYSLPASTQHYRSLVWGFMAGKLCLMSHFKDGACEVWVMNEYGVAESWVRHHVFPQHVGIERPFGFTKNSEFVFEADGMSLALYDPVTAKVKSFEMTAPPGISNIRTKVVPYVDSLVWVAPAKHGINVSSLAIKKRKKFPGSWFIKRSATRGKLSEGKR